MSFVCKLTGNPGKPIEAHILPKAFYELRTYSPGSLKLLSNTAGEFPRRTPVGIYDKEIVTADGESILARYDDYAIKVLLNRIDEFRPIQKDGVIGGWTLSGVDCNLLKLFALSLLWRAGASTHSAYHKVKLGPHEQKLHDMVLNGSPEHEESYSVVFARWFDEIELGPVIMDPFSERYLGVRFYRFYCGRYVIYIKVDQQKTPENFSPVQLSAGKVLTVISRNLKQSSELTVIKNIVQASSQH